MYWSNGNGELSKGELNAARLGFKQLLACKRFSPHFIETHGDDLFGTATLEYSRKLAEGEEIENPAGWIISCAWQRTKSQLEAESRRPHMVSTEKSGPLVDDARPGPEDAVLDEDRLSKVRRAVEELSPDQRRILAQSYFEGFTVREAGRRLNWHPSKAQRAHEGAKRRLHELLGVKSSDDLEVEIGLAAYLSLTVDASTGGLLERTAQRSAEGLTALKQQIIEGGAQLKQHAATGYYRAVDPTPLAAARPGTVASVVAGCIALGSGATYCVEQGLNPVGAARGLITASAEPTHPPPEPPETPPAPVYTPVEPPASEEPAPEPAAPPAEETPKPKPEPPPPEASFEPVSPAYASSEGEAAYEAPEPAPAENPEPAPVPANAGPQFGGP